MKNTSSQYEIKKRRLNFKWKVMDNLNEKK